MNDRTFDELFKPIVISIMIVLNITLNGLTIAVIARYPQLRDDRTTLFIFSLALSDLANGCTAMPISAALCSSATPSVRHETNVLPRINAVVSVWFSVTSMHSLCWLTLCKMVAITNPLRYEEILTRNRCYFIICGLWLTGALSGGTVAYYVESWHFDICLYQVTISKGNVGLMSVVFIIAILCPVVCFVYSTTRIFRAILQTHRQIAAQVISIGGENNHVATTPYLTLKSVRSGRNVLIVCSTLVVLAGPFLFQAIAVLMKLEDVLPSWYLFGAIWMYASNTFINSFVYIIVFRCVRDKTADMLRSMYLFCFIR